MPLTQNQFYCVSSRHKVTLKTDDICVKEFRNPRMKGGKAPAIVGYCEKCRCNLTKFIKKKDVAKLVRKFGKC